MAWPSSSVMLACVVDAHAADGARAKPVTEPLMAHSLEAESMPSCPPPQPTRTASTRAALMRDTNNSLQRTLIV
jgi:hypothetical protein